MPLPVTPLPPMSAAWDKAYAVLLPLHGAQRRRTRRYHRPGMRNQSRTRYVGQFFGLFHSQTHPILRRERSGRRLKLAGRHYQNFPRTQHCRHYGGCNRACPKGLGVGKGVAQVVSGDFSAAALTFGQCVMCNLCSLSCPERIRSNHLGLKAACILRPVDLMRRLREIDSSQMKVVCEEEETQS